MARSACTSPAFYHLLVVLMMALCMIRPLSLEVIVQACTVSEDHRMADCRQKNLTEPPRYLPEITEHLDLSRNHIKMLIKEYWHRFPKLILLNMSSCGLSRLREDSFFGLRLKVLDLTNNPVLAYLPPKVFSVLNNLHTLIISGEVLPEETVVDLENLEELTLTFRNKPPAFLAHLPKLKVLTFAFSSLVPSGGRITAAMLEHLANSSIEELTFHYCDITEISHGAFDNFSRLKLLNFACNSRLQISNIIDVLSTVKTPKPVENLIVDSTQNTFTILGQQESKYCKAAWKNIKRLSMRNTNLYGFNVHFITNCLSSLESVAVGFNHPFFFNLDTPRSFFGGSNALKWLLQHASEHLVSVDVAHLLADNRKMANLLSGCNKEQAWIPNSWDLFPPHVAHRSSDGLDWHPAPNWSSWMRSNECAILHLPRNLTYLGMQHVGGSFSFFSATGYSCTVVLPNSLRRLNMSGGNTIASKRYLGSIYGLYSLESLDLSSNGLLQFNFSELVNFPSLRVLILKQNHLQSDGLLSIGKHGRLRILDLSYNKLVFIPRTMFIGLTSLSVLQLRGNSLSDVDFITENLKTLSHFDIGQNKLLAITKNTMNLLDKLFGEKKTFILELDGNNFEAVCNATEFVQWLKLTRISIKRKDRLLCS